MKLFSKFFAFLVSLVMVGAGCTSVLTGAVSANFDQVMTIGIGDTLKFNDGLSVTLKRIDDSRCPEDVQCVWSGELSATFDVKGGLVGVFPKEVQLGTVRAPERELDGYVFVLTAATASSASLNVKMNAVVSSDDEDSNGSQKENGDKVDGEGIVVAENITVTGTFACLPHKDTSGPITLECAFGIRNDNGVYYALDTTGLKSNALLLLNTGARITVKGLYTPIDLFPGTRLQKYAIKGVIQVKSVQEVK